MNYVFIGVLTFASIFSSILVNGQNEQLTSKYSRSNYFNGKFASSIKTVYEYGPLGNLIEEIQYSTHVDSVSFSKVKRKEYQYSNSGNLKMVSGFTYFGLDEKLESEIEYFYQNDSLYRKYEIIYDPQEIPYRKFSSFYNILSGKLDSTITVNLPPYQYGRKEIFNYDDFRTDIEIYLLFEDNWQLYNVEVKLFNENNQLKSYSFKYDDWSADLLYEYEYDLFGNNIGFKFKRGIYGTNQFDVVYQSDCEIEYNINNDIIESDCYSNQLSNGSVIDSKNINTKFIYYCDGPLYKKEIFKGQEFSGEEVYNYNTRFDCLIDKDLDVKLYPNPATNLLFLESESLGYEYIDYGIYDITGKELLNLDFNLRESIIDVDVSILPTGIYVFRIYDKQNVESIKFIKM